LQSIVSVEFENMSDMDVMTPAEANPQNVQDLTLFDLLRQG